MEDKKGDKKLEKEKQEENKEKRYIEIKISCISKESTTSNARSEENGGRKREIKKVHSPDEK